MPASIVFWDTDTQADFICPNGKLYVPGAEAIIPNLKRLTEWASKNGVLVVASACAHHKGDPEFAQYPLHCLVGTAGQKKIPETRLPNALTLPNRRVEPPRNPFDYRQIIFEKQQLDVFSNPNIEAVLARLGPVHEVVLYGVVTEICVAYAGRGLPCIELEDSLTAFVRDTLRLDPNGRSMRAVRDQLNRLAAASFQLGLSHDGQAVTVKSNVIAAFELWIPRDPGQRILWSTSVQFSQPYFQTLVEHAVPLDDRAIRRLAHSALCLDVYTWLAQRLRRVTPKNDFVPWACLK